MTYRYDSYCGLYCGACPVMLANEQGRLEQAAKDWKEKPDDLVCHGCKTDTKCIYCKECTILDCTHDHRVEFCCDCPEYPCKTITDFNNDKCAHHSIVLQNLNRIRDVGIYSWLKEQKVRWSCPECGERFSWYDDKCGNCGQAVRSCRVDDQK